MDENEKMNEISQIRWMNLIGLNGYLSLGIISHLLNGKDIFFVTEFLSLFGVLFGYYFMFIGSWFFFIFIVTEIKFCIRKKKNFMRHVFENKKVLWGIIPAIIIVTFFTYKIT